MLAGPGTPRDPKSHFFGTKLVAIQPYGTPGTAFCTEFRSGTRQIGPTTSISTFFWVNFDPQNAKNRIFWEGFEKIFENRPGCPKMVPQGPEGPWGYILLIFPLFLGPLGGPGPPIFPFLGAMR